MEPEIHSEDFLLFLLWVVVVDVFQFPEHETARGTGTVGTVFRNRSRPCLLIQYWIRKPFPERAVGNRKPEPLEPSHA